MDKAPSYDLSHLPRAAALRLRRLSHATSRANLTRPGIISQTVITSHSEQAAAQADRVIESDRHVTVTDKS